MTMKLNAFKAVDEHKSRVLIFSNALQGLSVRGISALITPEDNALNAKDLLRAIDRSELCLQHFVI